MRLIITGLLFTISGCAAEPAEIQFPSHGAPEATMTPLPEPAIGAGREWRVVESPQLDGANLFEVMAFGDLLLAAGNQADNGRIWISEDGIEWEPAQPASVFEDTLIWGLVPWDGGVLALGGRLELDPEPPPVALTSADGRVWQRASIGACWPDFADLNAAAIADEALILTGTLGRQPGGDAVCRLADAGPGLPDEGAFRGSRLSDVAARDASVLVVGTRYPRARAWLSTDNGAHFADVPMSEGTGAPAAIALTDDGFLVVGTEKDGAVAWHSPDGSAWEVALMGHTTGEVVDVARGAAGFVAVGHFGGGLHPRSQARLSADGMVWDQTQFPFNEDGRMHAITAWRAGYAAVGDDLVWLSP